MADYFRFMKLYWTELIHVSFDKLIVDPVRVEVFRGPRKYDVLERVSPPVVPSDRETIIVQAQTLEVPGDRTYIELVARTKEATGNRQYCEDQIDRVVANISAQLSPNLFAQEMWRGWLGDHQRFMGGFWLMRSQGIEFEAAKLQNALRAFQRAIESSVELNPRFTLMAKLFSRALSTPPGEERFLWLWTVLEVFPMKDTSNIQPISDYLANVLARPAKEVKEQLMIGKLFGARCALVHDGKLPCEGQDLAGALNLLEAIDLTVLRSLGGLPYSGELDTSFTEPYQG